MQCIHANSNAPGPAAHVQSTALQGCNVHQPVIRYPFPPPLGRMGLTIPPMCRRHANDIFHGWVCSRQTSCLWNLWKGSMAEADWSRLRTQLACMQCNRRGRLRLIVLYLSSSESGTIDCKSPKERTRFLTAEAVRARHARRGSRLLARSPTGLSGWDSAPFSGVENSSSSCCRE